jgi:hypothetical protein
MKKIIIIGIGVVVLIIAAVLSWHFKTLREADANTFRKLIGGWHVQYVDGLNNVTTIRPDASFACSVIPADNRGLLYDYKGTLQVKNGIVIETVTNHSDTNVQVPFTARLPIVRLNNNSFVVRTNGTTNELVFWKLLH